MPSGFWGCPNRESAYKLLLLSIQFRGRSIRGRIAVCDLVRPSVLHALRQASTDALRLSSTSRSVRFAEYDAGVGDEGVFGRSCAARPDVLPSRSTGPAGSAHRRSGGADRARQQSRTEDHFARTGRGKAGLRGLQDTAVSILQYLCIRVASAGAIQFYGPSGTVRHISNHWTDTRQ